MFPPIFLSQNSESAMEASCSQAAGYDQQAQNAENIISGGAHHVEVGSSKKRVEHCSFFNRDPVIRAILIREGYVTSLHGFGAGSVAERTVPAVFKYSITVACRFC